MMSVKLVVIMILASALFTAGLSQLRPVLAISNQKQQLLEKIFSEEKTQEMKHLRPYQNRISLKTIFRI